MSWVLSSFVTAISVWSLPSAPARARSQGRPRSAPREDGMARRLDGGGQDPRPDVPVRSDPDLPDPRPGALHGEVRPDEVPEAVEDRLSAVHLQRLEAVGVPAEDHVRAGVDQLVALLHLVGARLG